MKLKYIYAFLTLFSFSPIYSFDVTSYLHPIFSYVVGTFGYFSCITDHFMPATQQELFDTKQEIKQLIENNAHLMREHAQKNIHASNEQTKKELADKIDVSIVLCTQESSALRQALHSTQKIINRKLERNHRIRMRSLKQAIDSFYDNSNRNSEATIKKITFAYEERDKQIQKKCREVLNILVDLQKSLNQKTKNAELTLQSTLDEQKIQVLSNCQQVKKESAQIEEKSSDFFIKTNEKIDSIERLCCILKGMVSDQKQKNAALNNQIKHQKNVPSYSSFSSFSSLRYPYKLGTNL